MKQTLLLVAAMALVSFVNAQKKITAYAITGMQKGQSGWSEVRLIDITTGDEVQPIYQSTKIVDVLNARTGKPVVKKALADNTQVYAIRQMDNLKEIKKIRDIDKLKELPIQENQIQQDNLTLKRKLDEVVVINTN